MAEYIELNEAFETITNFAGRAGSKAEYSAYWKSAKALKTIPIADVAEVRHGKWIFINQAKACFNAPYGDISKCSLCGHKVDVSETNFNYCPQCGAKMDKE